MSEPDERLNASLVDLGWLDAEGTPTEEGFKYLSDADLAQINGDSDPADDDWADDDDEDLHTPKTPLQITEPVTYETLSESIKALPAEEVIAFAEGFIRDPLATVDDGDPWSGIDYAAQNEAANICLGVGLKSADRDAFIEYLQDADKLREVTYAAIQGNWTPLRSAAFNFKSLR